MKKSILTVVVLLGIMLASCNFPMVQDNEAKLATTVAETVEALEAEVKQPPLTIPTQEPPAPPPATPEPTIEVKPTSTSIPCLYAAFVSETIKDNTEMGPNQSFTKSWTLKNTGSCTWNKDYKLVFSSGNQMSGPKTQNFTKVVKPGETIELKLDLVAPSKPDTYKGTWKLRTDKGVDFGLPNGIWVLIKVKM